MLPDYFDDNTSINFTIHQYQINTIDEKLYLPFTSINISHQESQGSENTTYTIQGRVSNPNMFGVKIQKIIVTLIDNNEQLIGYRIFRESQILQSQEETLD